MSSVLQFVGLDVHKESIVVAVASHQEQPRLLGRFGRDFAALVKRLRRLAALEQLRCCYEAGPTGYGLCRRLRAAGIDCEVIAPSLTPRRAGDRVKTDTRDALSLARYLRSGDLTSVAVPEPATEALRDLVRARDDAKRAQRVARQQLSKFLLRHDRVYYGKTRWTGMHLDWIRTQNFKQPAHQEVLVDALHTVEMATDRVTRLTERIGELIVETELAPLTRALQSFRGIDLVTAATVSTELADLRRFARAPSLMAYLGLIPSESSSGETRRRGSITKTGNGHVRRVLVEAAWAYRFPPKRGFALRKRSAGVAPEVQRIAWKAQHRLHARYRRMRGRGITVQKTVTAIARELAGFIWAVGQRPHLVIEEH